LFATDPMKIGIKKARLPTGYFEKDYSLLFNLKWHSNIVKQKEKL